MILLALALLIPATAPFWKADPQVHVNLSQTPLVFHWNTSGKIPDSINYEMSKTFLLRHEPGYTQFSNDAPEVFMWDTLEKSKLSDVHSEIVGKIDNKEVITITYGELPIYLVAIESSLGFFRPFFISILGESYESKILPKDHSIEVTTSLLGVGGYSSVDSFGMTNGSLTLLRKGEQGTAANP